MNIAINIICVYLAREKVIKINLFCGDKANRRADPAAEYRRKQGASGLEDLRPETESGVGDLHQLVEIRAFPGANRHPLQNAVKKLRQLRDIAARGSSPCACRCCRNWVSACSCIAWRDLMVLAISVEEAASAAEVLMIKQPAGVSLLVKQVATAVK